MIYIRISKERIDIGLNIMEKSIFLAKSLKEAREKKGLRQRELSVKTGITQSQISKFENGAVDLQLSSLIELSRELELGS